MLSPLGPGQTYLDNFMILVEFPHTLEDEDETHAGEDQREDDEYHH